MALIKICFMSDTRDGAQFSPTPQSWLGPSFHPKAKTRSIIDNKVTVPAPLNRHFSILQRIEFPKMGFIKFNRSNVREIRMKREVSRNCVRRIFGWVDRVCAPKKINYPNLKNVIKISKNRRTMLATGLSLAEQRFTNALILLSSGNYEQFVDSLDDFCRSLSTDYLFKVSESYRPVFVRRLFANFLPLQSHTDARVRQAVVRFFGHASSLWSAVFPDKFIRLVRQAFRDAGIAKFLGLFVGQLGFAVSRVPVSSRLRYFPFLLKFLQSLTSHGLSRVPVSLWGVVFQYGQEKDLDSLLRKCVGQGVLSRIGSLISCQKDDFCVRLFEVLNLCGRLEFLKGIRYCWDCCDLIESYKTIYEDASQSDFERVYDLFTRLLRGKDCLNTNERTAFGSVVKSCLGLINEVNSSQRRSIIRFLYEVSVRGIHNLSSLLDLIDKDDASKVSVRIYLGCKGSHFECDGFREWIHSVAEWHSSGGFIILAEGFDWSQFCDVDNDFGFSLIEAMIRPFPVVPRAAVAAIRLLNGLPSDVLSRICLDLRNLLIRFHNSVDDDIVYELRKLITRFGYEVTIIDVNLLCSCSETSFEYFDRVPLSFFDELLSSGLIPPRALYSVFRFLAVRRSTFLDLIDLLELEVLELGIDFHSVCVSVSLVLEVREREHRWISGNDLRSLLGEVNGDFFKSGFGRLMSATLESLIAHYDFEVPETEDLQRLSLLVSFVIHIFTESATSLFLLIYQNFVNRQRPSSMEAVIRDSLDRIWRQELPISSAVSLARLAILSEGVRGAATRHGDFVAAAAATDRDLARQLGNDLPRPLVPMPTFLAFVGVAEFSEYVDVCQAVLPASEWVLRAADAEVIDQLPQSAGSSAARETALSRVRALSQPPEIAAVPIPVTARPRIFSFHPPTVIEVCQRIRPSEPATLENVRAFLWHTGEALPEGFSADTLEAIVSEHPCDSKLLTAFFLWATAHGRALDGLKWIQFIRVDCIGESAIACIAALLGHFPAGGSLPRSVLRRVESVFELLGLPLTAESVARLLRQRRCAVWLLARNLARADAALFGGTVSALGRTALADDVGEFVALLPSVTRTAVGELFSVAVDLLLRPLPQELYLFDATFPPAYADAPQLLGFFLDATLPYPRPLDGAVLRPLIETLERLSPLPFCWVEFFGQTLLDEEAVVRVRSLFNFEGGTVQHIFPTLFPIGGRRTLASANGSVDSDVRAFFADGRPSLTRAFVRGLRSAVLPGNLLSRELFRTVTPLLTPVFPALAYSGTASLGLRRWSDATPLSALRFGIVSPTIGAGLMRGLQSRSWEALAICIGLLQLPPKLLILAVSDVAPAMAREAVLRGLLDSAVALESNISFAARAIDCALYCAQEDQVMVVVANADFLSRPNFGCVCVIFRRFMARVSQPQTAAILDFCRLLQGRAAAIFPDELRRRAIADLNDPANIAAFLHGALSE
jgi:hypothetical protein